MNKLLFLCYALDFNANAHESYTVDDYLSSIFRIILTCQTKKPNFCKIKQKKKHNNFDDIY